MDAGGAPDHETQTVGSLPLRETPWRWTDVLVGLAPILLLLLARPLLQSWPGILWVPGTLLVLAWMLAYPLLRARPVLPRARDVLVEGLFALLALPVFFAVQAGVSVLARPFGGSQGQPFEAITRSPNRFELLALIIIGTTLAPVAEEVFFRGMLYNALRRRIYRVPAALAQGILFGLCHPFDWAQQVAISAVGVSFAGLYEWRKTLCAPILVHALANAVGMAVMLSQPAPPVLGVIGSPHEHGCLIAEVENGTPAQECGLRAGDVVTAVDDEEVANFPELARVIRTKKVGDRITVDYLRDGQPHRVEALLKEWPR